MKQIVFSHNIQFLSIAMVKRFAMIFLKLELKDFNIIDCLQKSDSMYCNFFIIGRLYYRYCNILEK